MGDKWCLPLHEFLVPSGVAQIPPREELGHSGDEFWCVFSPDMGSGPGLVNLPVSCFSV